jgi:AcrR family transcriptional regulator
MAEDESRRERKKRQTRKLLVDTAVRLFTEQGYERTTVAQITAAADVATKTFFNYFPTKEDVLFSEVEPQHALLLAMLADRRPDEDLSVLLTRLMERVIADYRADSGPEDRELANAHAHLVASVPALQAKALHVQFDFQRRMAAALVRAFPNQLDPIAGAAVAGCLLGAVQAAGAAGAELGQSGEDIWRSVRRGFDIAMAGVRAL